MPGQWVLVEARTCTHDTGELWLGRTVACSLWRSNPCKRLAANEMARDQAKKKMHEIMFDRKDYMVAVQWYKNVPDDEEELLYVREEPKIWIFNSTELRLAAFRMEQVEGARPINVRPRRGGAAEDMEEIEQGQKWRISVETKLRAFEACRGPMRGFSVASELA